MSLNQKYVLSEYNRIKSISGAAKACKVSYDVVHKVLVTYGVINTPLTRRIAELRRVGMSQKDIAELLDSNTTTISRNTPYDRRSYKLDTPSKNAVKLRKWRANKRTISDATFQCNEKD